MNKIILIFCLSVSFNIYAEELSGLFGFKMGQVIDTSKIYDPNGNPLYLNKFEYYFEEKLDYDNYHYIELKTAGSPSVRNGYLVLPLIKNEYFEDYKLIYSPLSHRIIEIKAVGKRIPDEDRCKVILSNIYYNLVLKYTGNSINSRLSIPEFNTDKNIIFIDINKDDLNQEEEIISNSYLDNLFEEGSLDINDQFVKETYNYILNLRDKNFEAINNYVLELNCFDEKFNLSISSPQLEKMNQGERKIIRRWGELIRYSYINDDVDIDGF